VLGIGVHEVLIVGFLLLCPLTVCALVVFVVLLVAKNNKKQSDE